MDNCGDNVHVVQCRKDGKNIKAKISIGKAVALAFTMSGHP